jgi:hypothetical protein
MIRYTPRIVLSFIRKEKLATLEVLALSSECRSISANYGPPAERNQGIKQFVQLTKR